jgi:hypothetical protein
MITFKVFCQVEIESSYKELIAFVTADTDIPILKSVLAKLLTTFTLLIFVEAFSIFAPAHTAASPVCFRYSL